LSEASRRLSLENFRLNPKSGKFITHVNAKTYSFKSPSGEVFICRNLKYFIDHNVELFRKSPDPEKPFNFKTTRETLASLAPWQNTRRIVWKGWTWYKDTPSSRIMRRVILSLGSNIEPRRTSIDNAVDALSALPDVRDVRRSPLYETAPDGVPETYRDQPFLNGIVTLETRMPPLKLLKALQEIEKRLGRKRGETHGTPRTIDIDIIAIEDMRVLIPDLIVPHPRATARRFVLQPLADLLPDFRFPGQTQSVRELLEGMSNVQQGMTNGQVDALRGNDSGQ